jgi:uncharacterized protein YfaS (alpha-2-macroglobulin family)
VTNASGREVWRGLTVSGRPKDAPPPLAKGFTLTKELYHFDGGVVDPAQVRQNDRFIVSLRGRAQSDVKRQAILVDLLPAGLEIEAILPRLAPDAASPYPFLPNMTGARVREARDDRLVVAFDVKPPECRYCGDDEPKKADWHDFAQGYIVRAVSQGGFTFPAAQVEDMYAPSDLALTRVQRLTVAPPR